MIQRNSLPKWHTATPSGRILDAVRFLDQHPFLFVCVCVFALNLLASCIGNYPFNVRSLVVIPAYYFYNQLFQMKYFVVLWFVTFLCYVYIFFRFYLFPIPVFIFISFHFLLFLSLLYKVPRLFLRPSVSHV